MLTAANQYRNNIAHWGLSYYAWDGKRQIGWHLADPKAAVLTRIFEIDKASMLDAESTIEVADKAVLAAAGPPFWEPDKQADRNLYSIAEKVIDAPGTWDTDEDLMRFRAKALEIFPR